MTCKLNNSRLYTEACEIIDTARNNAYRSINHELVLRNWLLGRLIAEEELMNKERAEYGLKTMSILSHNLTETYGKGFSRRELYSYLNFYRCRPDLFVENNQEGRIVYSLSSQSAGLPLNSCVMK